MLSNNVVNGDFLRVVVVINATEMIPMIFLLAIGVSPAGKLVANPSVNLVRFTNHPVPVQGMHYNCLAFFCVISPESVIEDCIKVYSDVMLLGRITEI